MLDDAPRNEPVICSVRPQDSVVIGVTGHRPARLHDAVLQLLGACIREILTEVQATVPSGVMTILSPLAEGVDQLVARVAQALGGQFVCPLPFALEVYANDFATVAARAEHRALLALATRVIELDGDRTSTKERDAA